MLPTIVGQPMEDYLQENVLKPLGMSHTTFYPFSPEWKDKLLPIRFGQGAEQPGEIKWEELNGQLDLLTLPRT
jgi:CubicO group peptidase (beta-lactamase class C family)